MKSRYLLGLVIVSWFGAGLSLPVMAAPTPSAAASSAHLLEDGLDAYQGGQFRRALALLEPLARDGNAEAAFTLAMMYSSGRGVTLDEKQALLWFERAAAVGHRDSEYFLARSHEQGWGTVPSPAEAAHWYQRCAEHGDARCRTRLTELPPAEQRPAAAVASPPLPLPVAVTAAPLPVAPKVAAPAPVAPLPSAPVMVPVAPTVLPVAPPAAPSTEAAPVSSAIHGVDWVKAQPPNHYTIQLIASPRAQDLPAFVQQHALSGDLAMTTELRHGQVWYGLLYGSFKTKAMVNQALAALPPATTKAGAWMRRFRDLRLVAPSTAASAPVDQPATAPVDQP